jgi:hypothetical protein
MILLDKKDYNHEELLAKMVDDDFYYNTMNVSKVLSYSSAKWLMKSPKYFVWKQKQQMTETQALRDGKLIHMQILEPEKYNKLTFVDVSSKNTKVWKEAVLENGKENTYTVKERNINNRIVQSFLRNNTCMGYLKGNQFEVPALCDVDGIPFRGKADILGDDFIADVKTTGDGVAEIDLRGGGTKNQFQFTVDKYDYDLQAYIYTVMFNKPRFIWLVIDKVTTEIGVFEASQELLERGKYKLEEIVSNYNTFFVDELIDLDQYLITKTI